MLIIPAIDLLDGKCVRLFKGDYGQSTIYEENPAVMARRFEDMGVKKLHVVDLDAARGQGKHNRIVIENICCEFKGIVEVGGGVRAEEDIEALLSVGVHELIAGTVFAKTPELVGAWVKKYKVAFVAGIDALDGDVKISGWEEGVSIKDTQLAEKACKQGISSIIYTNISRDGTLSGPDYKRTLAVAASSGLPVILSGGVSCEEDIEKAAVLEPKGITGVITGKAFYEGRLDLEKMIRRFQKD